MKLMLVLWLKRFLLSDKNPKKVIEYYSKNDKLMNNIRK